MPALKFTIDGTAAPLEDALRKADAAIAKSAQNAFVWEQRYSQQGSKLDPEKSRQFDIEQAARNNEAARLRRIRAKKRMAKEEAAAEAEEVRKGLLIEQNLRDQQAVKNAHIEQATRDNRARALRRERARQRAERQNEINAEIEQGFIPQSFIVQRALNKKFPGGLRHQGAFMGASAAMMVSVARDTMASLASGANPMTVFMQQAPQVMQAMTMMNVNALSFIKTLAKLPVGPWATFGGIVAGLGVGFLVAYWHVNKLIDKLTGFKMPDIEPEYIAKHLQKANLVAEAWKDIAKAIRSAREEYAFATRASERYAAEVSQEFSQRRALLEMEKQAAMARAGSPGARLAVEREYGLRGLQISANERADRLRQQEHLRQNLIQEAKRQFIAESALLGSVPGKDREQQDVDVNKRRLEAAQQAWKAVQEARNSPGIAGLVNMDKIFRTYNDLMLKFPQEALLRKVLGGQAVTDKDLDDAEMALQRQATELKLIYHRSVDSLHENDQIRERANELNKKAAQSLAKAAEIEASLADDKQKYANENYRDRQLFDARQKLLVAQMSSSSPAQLTERERIGLGAASGFQFTLLDVTKKSEQHLANLVALARQQQNNPNDGSF